MYKELYKILGEYWGNYGGSRAFFKSPYVHISFVTTVILSYYFNPLKIQESAIQILPNILGFSIGSFAIIFSSMEKIKQTFIEKIPDYDYKKSLNVIITTFLHFIIVQNFVLIIAILKQNTIADDYHSINSIFFFVFLYSVFLVFSTAISLYRFIRMILQLY